MAIDDEQYHGRDEKSFALPVAEKIYAKVGDRALPPIAMAMVFVTQAIFYGLAWLPWNGRQAVLFDLGALQVLHL